LTTTPSGAANTPPRRGPGITLTVNLGWVELGFLALLAVALGLRLWGLDGRAVHYDEAIHLQAAWRLAEGHEFLHSPWMHGPFQVEYTALILWIFGDTDFTARMGYAFFGVALVGLPYFLRGHLGNAGALIIGVLLTLSPVMLYFSRFGRNDIIMAFWASALLVLMWRYFHEGKNRYLFLASAVLALMFATKETAYLVTLVFGGMAFLLALPQLAPWVLGKDTLARMTGPAGFLLLLITLTLPQWMPAFSLIQGPLGLTLANAEGVTGGLVGAPQWEAPYLALPLFEAQWWLHLLVLLLVSVRLSLISRRAHLGMRELPRSMGVPLASIAAAALIVMRPLGHAWDGFWGSAADPAVAGILIFAALMVLFAPRYPWRKGALLLVVPAALTALYLTLFTTVADIDRSVHWLLPPSVSVEATANGLPLNYLVASGLIFLAICFSIFLGVRWLGGAWLGMAAIFYVIWTTLYTTFFTNLAGNFSGVWQGMGYWIAQQEVARGNQPWYYYFVGLSVYEVLPVVFGIAGAAFFLRRGEVLGLVLTLWAVVTMLAYTIASEKMPWLMVNLALPLIYLSGAYLGRLMELVRWRQVLVKGYLALLVVVPLTLAAGVYLLLGYLDPDTGGGTGLAPGEWTLLGIIALAALAAAYLVRVAPSHRGTALAGLGLAALLLGFGAWGSFRAAYTYDDSNVEILVYAQGGADLKKTFLELNRQVFRKGLTTPVVVDYDVWYPFQWYVRHPQDQGKLSFACFQGESEPGWNSSCKRVNDSREASARVLTTAHGIRDSEFLEDFRREGPFQNLLWFPESYRRPGEDRPREGSFLGFRGVPNKAQISKDLGYFRSVATSRDSWNDALNYWIFRRLDDKWFDAQYYSYLPVGPDGP
jgi:4-amino-4-deoxy-L-arabinose transferase-like glycosyltransferase